MKGSMKNRYEGSWTLIVDLGPGIDPKTGTFRKRRQQTETFRGSKREAEDRLTELVRQVNRHQYVRPSKLTVAGWLAEWLVGLRARVNKGLKPTTIALYQRTIDKHIAPSNLGHMRLQRVRPMDVEQYFASLPFATKTLDLHRTVLQGAFKFAKKNQLVEGDNPVKESDRAEGDSTKPRRQRKPDAWIMAEAQAFIAATKKAGPQPAALYSLALDSGARKGELLGLRWSDVDLKKGTITINQQLLSNPETFGSPKTEKSQRTIDLGDETVHLLATHKRTQSERKLARAHDYRKDLDLVFALPDGLPLKIKSIGQGEFSKIIKAAEVKPIRFHDMRHTTATLFLLTFGEQWHVLSKRLGHAKVTETMNTYTHVLDSQAQTAGRTLGALLHGSK